MKILETERLILRPFIEGDFEAVHAYASVAENVIYMVWGPNNELDTLEFILQAIKHSKEVPYLNYQFAAIEKESRKLIGACNIVMVRESEGEIGWILHRDYWKQGFGTEMGKKLLQFGFQELGLHRIIAHCDTENYGSFRVMEKIGMRREGHFLESRLANKFSKKKYGDEYSYTILTEEWEMHKKRLKLVFPTVSHKEAAISYKQEFLDNGEMKIYGGGGLNREASYELWLEKIQADLNRDSEGFVPATTYFAFVGDELVGSIQIRHRLNDYLYQRGGHIGYSVAPSKRQKGYATEMLRLALKKCQALGMEKVLITCDKDNMASAATILKNHGVLENEVPDDQGRLIQRYWIEIKRGEYKCP